MDDTPDPGPQGATVMPSVLVSNRQDLPVDHRALAALASSTLASEGRSDVELSLSFVGEDEMADLHVRYMDEPGLTDVLSFPMDEDGLLGDVVVCPAEARRNNPDVGSELRLLVVHGVLHLLGYDHEGEEDRRLMWARQDRYVSASPP